MAHSELPPSSADKWLFCSGWRKINLTLPPGKSSDAAQEGTDAHLALSEVLEERKSLAEIKDPVLSDAIGAIQDIVAKAEKIPGTDIYVEYRLDFGKAFDYIGLTGTADLVIDSPDYLEILDFKYGKQIVEVQRNPQLMVYLIGAVAEFGERDYYKLTIAQPRADHFDGPIRTYIVYNDELEDFRAELESAIVSSYRAPKFNPGPHCKKYCNALAVCPGVRELIRKTFLEAQDD